MGPAAPPGCITLSLNQGLLGALSTLHVQLTRCPEYPELGIRSQDTLRRAWLECVPSGQPSTFYMGLCEEETCHHHPNGSNALV